MTSSTFASSTLVTGEALAGQAKYAGRSLAGGRRHNEDGFLCMPRAGLFAVADGMGGHNAGEVASALALEKLGSVLSARRALQGTPTGALVAGFESANRHVFQDARENKEHTGMGCTLSAVLLASPILVGAHVGDSRVYHLRDGALVQLTTDHCVPGVPHVITRAIGTTETIRVDAFSTRIEPEDALLLCTDGVSNALPDAMIARLLGSARRAPRDRGGRDPPRSAAQRQRQFDRGCAADRGLSIERRDSGDSFAEGGQLRPVGHRAVQESDLPEVKGRVLRFDVEGGSEADLAAAALVLTELVRVARARSAARVEMVWEETPVVRAARALETGPVERSRASSVEALVQWFAERMGRLQSQASADRLATEIQRTRERCSAVELAVHLIAWCASRAHRATLFGFLASLRAAELGSHGQRENIQ